MPKIVNKVSYKICKGHNKLCKFEECIVFASIEDGKMKKYYIKHKIKDSYEYEKFSFDINNYLNYDFKEISFKEHKNQNNEKYIYVTKKELQTMYHMANIEKSLRNDVLFSCYTDISELFE